MAGRKSKYETHVKSRFDEIRKWIDDGATDQEVIQMLGIGKCTFYSYLNQHKELKELMRSQRSEQITKLKQTLFKKAIGFQYTESKEIIDADGNTRKEIYTKTSLPNETAIMMLLKHWDKDDEGQAKWMTDPATYNLKKEELEFKKIKFEDESW